jgi:hypothetical protein
MAAGAAECDGRPELRAAARAFSHEGTAAVTAELVARAVAVAAAQAQLIRIRLGQRPGSIFQLQTDVPDIAGSVVELALQAATHHRSQRRWHVARQAIEVRVALENCSHGVGRCVVGIETTAGQHLEEHAAERPDVSTRVDITAANLFGAHIRRRSEDLVSSRNPACFRLAVHRHGVAASRAQNRNAEVE